ncbi:MAG: hypothetical protein GW757_11530 [Alphaproteobacteria bacterium]|nr:hypothetical protein [Alphaproteobacteria bacterium]
MPDNEDAIPPIAPQPPPPSMPSPGSLGLLVGMGGANPQDTRALPDEMFTDTSDYLVAWLRALNRPDLGHVTEEDAVRHASYLKWAQMVDNVFDRWATDLQVGVANVTGHPVNGATMIGDHLLTLGSLIRAAGNMYAHPTFRVETFDGFIAEFVHTALVLAQAVEADFGPRYQAEPLDWEHKWVDVHGLRMHEIKKKAKIHQAILDNDYDALMALTNGKTVDAARKAAAPEVEVNEEDYGPRALDEAEYRALPEDVLDGLRRSNVAYAAHVLSSHLPRVEGNEDLHPKFTRAIDKLSSLALAWEIDGGTSCLDYLPLGWEAAPDTHPEAAGIFLPRELLNITQRAEALDVAAPDVEGLSYEPDNRVFVVSRGETARIMIWAPDTLDRVIFADAYPSTTPGEVPNSVGRAYIATP